MINIEITTLILISKATLEKKKSPTSLGENLLLRMGFVQHDATGSCHGKLIPFISSAAARKPDEDPSERAKQLKLG